MRRAAGTSLVLACVLLAFAGITAAPLAFRAMASAFQVNWPRVADVGQTYEGIGGLLTVVALVGVAASLIVQLQEAKAGRLQTLRNFHLDLIKLGLEDPALMRTWIGQSEVSPVRMREIAFINMALWFHQMRWELKDMTELELRTTMSVELFTSEASRDYWRQVRMERRTIVTQRGRRRFYEIVEEEYQKAMRAGPAPIPSADRIRRAKVKRIGGTCTAVVAAGLLIGISRGRR